VSIDPTSATPFTLLDADVVERVRRLELFSRFRVDGFLSGLNQSPLKGFSADFLQHRPYFPGDSLRYLDWRVYGKCERLHVRQYEEQTNARISVVLDVSASMGFRGAGRFSKHEFGVRCAALLLTMAQLHRDSFALATFDLKRSLQLPFGSSRRHLQRCLEALLASRAQGGTDFPAGLQDTGASRGRRGLTLVLSDFMDDPRKIVRVIARLRLQGSDAVALQIFDPAEREMDFSSITRFHDMEGTEILVVDPHLVRRVYQREFDHHQVEMAAECRRHGFDHALLPVADEYDVPLLTYVRRRMDLFT